MYFRIKVSNIPNVKGIVTYLTEANNFADAGYKIIKLIGTDPEVEEVKMMKNIKPIINESYSDLNKLYMIKIAEDIIQEDNTIKTVKYELPAFANNADDLQAIVKNYIAQGLSNMRLTTISETKWIFV